jgi:hypothetical protein
MIRAEQQDQTRKRTSLHLCLYNIQQCSRPLVRRISEQEMRQRHTRTAEAAGADVTDRSVVRTITGTDTLQQQAWCGSETGAT